MRIRSIKPEFWRSEDIASLDWHDRLIFIGLWSYVDDNGVGRDVPAIIAADLFALDGDLTESSLRVQDGLSRLHTAGLIDRYTAHGKRFLHIKTWAKHQKINRPSPGRYPLPNGDSVELHEPLTEPSLSPHNILRAGTGEQGNRGTEEQVLSPAADAPSKSDRIADDFAEWYAAYPRKTARGRALTAYRTARKKTDAATLLAAIKQQAAQLMAKGSEFAPYPATWLNGERWLDEAPAPVAADDDDDWAEPVENRAAYDAWDAHMRAIEEANAR